MELLNKKILMIAPKYYGYEDYIRQCLEKQGATVYCIYENLDEVSFFYRFIYVYVPKKKREVLDRYYIRNLKKFGRDIDYVFAIRASSLSEKILHFMKKYYSKECQYIMYQWDGIKNNPNALSISKEFDKVFTFDLTDSHEMGWTYRPLFFINDLLDIRRKRTNDVLYICSLHSQRVDVLNKLKKICEKKGLTLHSHMYSKKLIYYKRKYLNKKEEYINSSDRDVSFHSLSIKDSYKLYGNSKVVVDFTHPGQTGYTMRTIECVGNKCKLVTNNEFIKTADFYDPHNVYIYSGTNVSIPEEFITQPYTEVDSGLYKYYSLEGWVETIFGA